MKGKENGIILAGVAACIGLLLLITPSYGADVVIGGDYTDVGSIIFVSPKSGDTDTANGTALLNTLADITDNDPAQKYLIKLGPGTYNLGSTSLQMKQYVSIEGSGEEVTTITAAISTIFPAATATVQGANNAGLRFLTVINTGAGNSAAAILNVSASPSIIHVTANASGGTVYNYGVFNSASSPAMTHVTVTASGGGGARAVYNYNGSSPVMTNVTATASGGGTSYGVINNASSPTMTNVTATGSDYGLYSFSSGTVKINHSVIKGTAGTIFNQVTTLVADTQLDGGAVFNSGILTCVGAYNASYVALNTSCQ